MRPTVGRSHLRARVREALVGGESVVLCGPAGIGRSALLDAVAADVAARDVVVLRCAGSPGDAASPDAAVRALLWHARTSADPRLRGLVTSLPTADPAPGELRRVLERVVARVAASHPVLLVADDLHWLDAASSDAVGALRRRLPGRVVLLGSLVAGAEPDPADLRGLTLLDVPPLDVVDLVAVLAEEGVGPDVAARLHRESAGNPALALLLAGAIGERPQVLGGPHSLPESLQRVLRARVAALPPPVRDTLASAALLLRPRVRDLARAGHLAAAEHVAVAASQGLVVLGEDDVVRFVPSVLRDLLAAGPAEEVAARHARLSASAADEPTRLRHRALADPRPDPDLARRLAEAATAATGRGARDLAADLLLLAADRADVARAGDRVEWLVSAAETAAPGNHALLVRRALATLREVVDPAPTPAQAVRARLAVPELAGLGVRALAEVLAAALADAGDDEALVAQVLLQRGRIALAEARPHATAEAAEQAVGLLRRVDPGGTELPRALATLAVARRWSGGDHRTPLAEALALAGVPAAGFWHVSPQYTRARFALYDDRPADADRELRDVLARLEPGAGADEVHVLRSLVEVAARTGHGREARELARRAEVVGAAFDLEAHTTWFALALAESVGGSVERAAALAQRGAEAATERGDLRYVVRHLAVLGQCRLRTGDLTGAEAAYGRIAAIEAAEGYDDPTVHRWQAEHAVVLVRQGRVDDAADLLAATRRRLARGAADPADPADTAGVRAVLDRAEAEVLAARGDPDGAVLLLEGSASVCADRGLLLDHARALLTHAAIERRRRRLAGARALTDRARRVLTDLGASAWLEGLEADDAPAPAGAGLASLTDAERRVAAAVAAGASNREIASTTYVSVKTVEATLTRIYRKLGVRSRAQLAALLATG
ncbi:AAA family ATPase [Nocardioides sp.]|uniref:helix-turn-helix transcriptional regulator n=1 Tax=Nocardioides sp. TaxID=35761 RepID=UPI003514ABA0